LREHADKSGDEVAGALHWSASKVSRIETNKTGVKLRDLNQLLNLYGVDEDRRRQLAALASEPEPRGWWTAYAESIAADYAAYISLEDSAASMSCWSPELIHGLLQTEAYVQAVMDIGFDHPPPISPGEVQRRVEVRLHRQDLLRGQSQKQMSFVLDESTLLHRFGTAAVMRAQLTHLLELSELPNVTIRVLAFSGAHPVVTPGGFAILEFVPVHGVALGDVVYTETLTHSVFIEEEGDTYEYRLAFGRLTAEALDSAASRALIAKVAEERWS
jgi:transcriptional regulator with XRE-family HTH domain